MPLDLLGAACVRPAQKTAVRTAPTSAKAQGIELDLIVKMLQRDDPSRRSYLQRRWHAQPLRQCNSERKAWSSVGFSR
jgi:hypothetical protein